mmetsp:Transcript_47383/g.112693  ORF Transcript_47383/g.112693 Transcript_47383/m.112693 type:complete len:391 (+) Transcript_47383:63-1235(+)
MGLRPPLSDVLQKLRVEPQFHGLLAKLCGNEADYLADITVADFEGSTDDKGESIAPPAARSIVRKLAQLSGSGQQQPQAVQIQLPPAATLSLPKDLADVKVLRAAVAAPGCPDEGMRGSGVDALRLQAAMDRQAQATLAKALRGKAAEAAQAAAAIRCIAISPAAASAVCQGGVAQGLVATLARPAVTAGPVLQHILLAIARIAQYRETQIFVLGAVPALEGMIRGRRQPPQGDEKPPRLDLVAAIIMAFLAESGGPSLALKVPLSVVGELVPMLKLRLFMTAAEEVCGSKAFCGLPTYYRPRFVLQAITRLAENSGAHAAMARSTELPYLLEALLDGQLPGDAGENKPFGSPDVVEMSELCTKALLGAPAGKEDAQKSLVKMVAKQSKL